MIPIVAIVITISFHLSPALLVSSSHPVLSPAASQFHLESAGYRQEILSNSCFETPKKWSEKPDLELILWDHLQMRPLMLTSVETHNPCRMWFPSSYRTPGKHLCRQPSRRLERSEASSLSALMEILALPKLNFYQEKYGKISFYSQPLVKYSKILDLVGGIPTPLKNMSSSVGMMTFPIYGKIKFMFQTTNQWMIFSWLKLVKNPPNPFWDQPAIISGPVVSPCLGCLGDFSMHQLSHPWEDLIIFNIVSSLLKPTVFIYVFMFKSQIS